MARKLKVYGGTYDGRNRVIVAAPNRADALRALNAAGHQMSMHGFREYGSETGNAHEIDVAATSPGTVFRRLDRYGPSAGAFVALTPKD